MAQVNVYITDSLAAEIRRQARRAGSSLSQYISGLLQRRAAPVSAWPQDFFTAVLGKWQGRFPTIDRPPADEPDVL